MDSSVAPITCCDGVASVFSLVITDRTSGQGGVCWSQLDTVGGEEWIGSMTLDISSSISKDGHWEEGKSVRRDFDQMSQRTIDRQAYLALQGGPELRTVRNMNQVQLPARLHHSLYRSVFRTFSSSFASASVGCAPHCPADLWRFFLGPISSPSSGSRPHHSPSQMARRR